MRRAGRPRDQSLLAAALCLLAGTGCAAAEEVLSLRAKVVASHPHAPDAFTQGLLWHEGRLYESTGQYGESSLRRVDPQSGEVLARTDVEDRLFAEGLARVGEELVQLTWRSGEAVVYDLESLEELRRHTYEGEGWGLCHDGKRLFMSDGSDVLTVRDPETFAVVDRLPVRLNGRPVRFLNELECAEGWIYANVWTLEQIVRIDPESGDVVAVIDASGLLAPNERAHTDVLNGIAYDPEAASFYLTGKYWPRVFEVVFVPAG